MSTKKFYAGIGSRDIPNTVKHDMNHLAWKLKVLGYTLRSGNATGADQAFATGAKEKAQIWLPWEKFEEGFQQLYPDAEYILPTKLDVEAWDSVEKFHPAYDQMKKGDVTKFITFMNFMTRNYRQVRGLNEPDSEFVICWTHDGTDVGGTGQAIRIARHFHIPVYNLFNMTPDEIILSIDKLKLL